MKTISISEIERGRTYKHDTIYALADTFWIDKLDECVFCEAGGRIVLFSKESNNRLLAQRIFDEVE
jgi:hypothetical protein